MIDIQDESGSNFERELLMIEIDLRAAQEVDRLKQERQLKEQFCREYRNRVRPGVEVLEAALEALLAIGVSVRLAAAVVAIFKVAKIGFDEFCQEFSAESVR